MAYDAIAPVGKALWEQLRKIHTLQVDETPVKMLSTNKEGFMWVYHSCDPENRFVIYEYNDRGSADVVNNRLLSFKGILQSDGYSAYNEQRKREDIINVGCFAHARRKFVEVAQASLGRTGKAHHAVTTIGKLYEIERESQEMNHAERLANRQEKVKPIIEEFYQWLLKSQLQAPQKSKLGNAINYAIKQWQYLSEYINHGEVEIDNNGVENKIRPFAIGRKNWMFIGNHRGAEAASLFYSLIETCKMNEIDPRKYFMKLFEQTHAMRRGDISAIDLLPQNLKKIL